MTVAEARAAHAAGAFRYCMVASGRGPSDRQIDFLIDAVREIKKDVPVQVCLSLGLLDEEAAAPVRLAPRAQRLGREVVPAEVLEPRRHGRSNGR